MDKHTMICPYNEYYSAAKKNKLLTHSNLDESPRPPAK